jgi:polysaccharide biosynthesis/export protein
MLFLPSDFNDIGLGMSSGRGQWSGLLSRYGFLLGCTLGLGGCAGMSQSYDTPARSNQIPFTVEPITPVLVSLLAQTPPPQAPVPQGTTEPGQYAYRIGPTDVMSIFVNQSLFADSTNPASTVDRVAESTYVVSSDGNIFLPLHGPLRVAGLTIGQAYDAIRDALGRYIAQPQINVRVTEYRSQRVAVVGEVSQPGFFPITDRAMTITEAVITAGRSANANLRKVVLKREGEEYLVDVFNLVDSPTFGQEWILQDGDVIVVPRNENKVYVLGEAPNRTQFIDPYTTTLAQILVPDESQSTATRTGSNYLQAGTAKPGSIFVIRGKTDAAQVYHLNGHSPEAFLLADQFQLVDGDIVFVSTRSVTRFNRFISQLLPSLTSLVAPIFIIDRIDNLGN